MGLETEFILFSAVLLILLCGGDKRSQAKDLIVSADRGDD